MPADFISRPPYNVIQPGAYSAVDASQLSAPNLLAGRPIPMIIGTALGGQPDVPLYFRSPGQLRQVLRSGVAYDAARFCFDGGAPQVGVLRVGNSITQASLALAGTGTVVTLTALDWGTWPNAITITVATGPIVTLSYTDQLGNVFTETWNFTGVGSLTPAFIASAINGGQYGYNASNFVTAVAGAGTLPLANISATPLSGGTDGLVPVAGDWTVGLAALESQLIDIIVPATGDATVQAQVLTHCQNLSAPNARHERVMVCGGYLGETVTYETATRIVALRTARAQLIYPGFWDYNASGVLTLYDPFYAAAKVAGMHCSLPDVATALTHKTVPIVTAEVNLSTIQGGAIDQLLSAGVTPIAPAPGAGYWIVDSLSGYNLPDQTFRDIHKTRSADYVAQYARQRLETQFVGSKRLASTQPAIQAAGGQLLQQLQGMGIIAAWKDVVVTAGPNINSFNVGLPVMLVDTNKFIFITVQLQPSATVSNSSVTAADSFS